MTVHHIHISWYPDVERTGETRLPSLPLDRFLDAG